MKRQLTIIGEFYRCWEGSTRTPVLMRLGQVLELVGQWDEAAACYAEALTVA